MPRFACMELMWGGVPGEKFEPWVDELAALGFDGIATRAMYLDSYQRDPQSFSALMARKKLALACVMVRMDEADARVEGLLPWMKATGCSELVLHGGTTRNADERRDAAKKIEAIGKQAAAFGIGVSYHHHKNNCFVTMEEAEELLKLTDERYVGGFLDTGHATQDFDGHPIARRAVLLLERTWPRVRYVEFKAWTEAKGLSSELGEGPLDLDAVVEFLVQHRYQGWITFEQNEATKGSTPGACAARGLGVARKLFQKHAAASAKQ